MSNILVNNPNVNQQEFLKRVFETFDFTDPDSLLVSNQAPEQPTPTTPEVTPDEAILTNPTQEGEQQLTNANTASEDMVAEDTAFLQNIGINA